MATPRPRRLTALERTAMTPEQELGLLVAEQERDDRHYVETPSWQVSFDANAHTDATVADLVARDPWGLVDAAIDLGLDPAEVAYAGELGDHLPRRRGLLHGDGLVDPARTPHATAGGYQNHKCRCIPCTNAWATYSRERRAARKAAA